MKKKLLTALSLLLICVFFMFMGEEIRASQTVKVGFFDYGNVIVWDEETQQYSGYGVSYINEICKNTKWTVEYVAGTWQECMDMLEKGEIDILIPAQKTQDRLKTFSFTNYSIGLESTAIFISNDIEDVFYDDYEYIEGKKVGVIKGSFQADEFRLFLDEKDISCTVIEYEDGSELMDKVEKGLIDAFAAGSLFNHAGFCIMTEFNPQPVYFMLNKQNTTLMDELNEALGKIKSDTFDFETNLYHKYFSDLNITNKLWLTKEEVEFIQNCPTIEIGLFTDYYPFSDYVDSEMTGICRAIFDRISLESGLKFTYVPVEDGIDPYEELLSGTGLNIIAGMMRSQVYLEDAELVVSDPFLNYEYVLIGRNGISEDDLSSVKVALPASFPYMKYMLEKTYEGIEIILYENNKQCINAIIDGYADITVQNEYVANYTLQKPGLSDLEVISNVSFSSESSIISNHLVDPMVIEIINKTVNYIGSSRISQIANSISITSHYSMTLAETIYAYRYFICIIVVVAIIVASIIFKILKEVTKAEYSVREVENRKKQLEISPLTGLYTKHAFYQKAKALISNNLDKKYLMITIDMEKFKIINDLFGLKEGDKLLTYFADILKEIANQSGIAGYRGADNFVLCVVEDEIGSIDELERQLTSYINTYGLDIRIQVCIGVYQIHNTDVDISIMCDRANLAAESIKGNNLKHYAYYDDSMREKLLRDQEILNDMGNALLEGQFKIYIQPKYSIQDEKIIGGEVLVRWDHPKRGIIPPGEFIPLFEKNGFISKLDFYVWTETCKLIRKWKNEGKQTFPLSVNVSRLNFYLPDLEKNFDELLNKFNLTTDDVYLEVTESAYTKEPEIIFAQLDSLQKKNYTILMDDFGSGYSSLNMLKEAPVDVIKLDMKFLLGNDDRNRSRVILETLIELAKKLGFKIIAEGVETKEQSHLLFELGCLYGQGYYFSKPIPSKEFELIYLN